MIKKFATLAAIMVLCAGCASFKSSKEYWKGVHEKYIADHPDIAPEVAEAIRRAEILMGMSEAEVVASIGRPHTINRSTLTWGTRAVFAYQNPNLSPLRPKYTFVYFRDGHVTSWSKNKLG